MDVSHGVPQGSLVGPILFSLFVNDLSNFLPFGRLVSYADDTQILDRVLPNAEGMSKLKDRTEKSLQALQVWFAMNSLKMNASKTDFIIIGTQHFIKKGDVSSFSFDVSGSKLKPSKSIRLLGVTVDQTLSWESHIGEVVRKSFPTSVALKRFRHHFTPEALRVLIQAHVLTHITYCLPVWAGATQEQLNRVQRCINFAARVITGARKFDHISPSLKSLGWSRLPEIIKEKDCIKVFKAITSDAGPLAVRSMFVTRAQVSSRRTRHSERGALQLPWYNLKLTKRCFPYRAICAWNDLPTTATSCKSIRSFKSCLKAVSQ